jgi:hypothetical protein
LPDLPHQIKKSEDPVQPENRQLYDRSRSIGFQIHLSDSMILL